MTSQVNILPLLSINMPGGPRNKKRAENLQKFQCFFFEWQPNFFLKNAEMREKWGPQFPFFWTSGLHVGWGLPLAPILTFVNNLVAFKSPPPVNPGMCFFSGCLVLTKDIHA